MDEDKQTNIHKDMQDATWLTLDCKDHNYPQPNMVKGLEQCRSYTQCDRVIVLWEIAQHLYE